MKKVRVLNIQQFYDNEDTHDFYVNTLEDHIATHHANIKLPHAHNFYVAVLFTHGSGIHEVDFNVYDIKPGGIFFLNPGQTHHWELSPDTRGFIILHTREFYELKYTQNTLSHFPFYYSMHNTPALYLSAEDTNSITKIFEQIYNENTAKQTFNQLAWANLVSLMYIHAARLYEKQNINLANADNSYYLKFIKLDELVEQHFRSEKSPAAYASLMAITPKHLNRISQSVTGKTVTDVILDRVMLEAKKLIVLQQGSLNQIAYSLGYDDYTYFSRLFKNRCGETPSKFLKRYGK